MIQYFGVEENQIQLILSINFAGLCLAGMVVGPLPTAMAEEKFCWAGYSFSQSAAWVRLCK